LAPTLLAVLLALPAAPAPPPALCFDTAHRNVHSVATGYAAFAEVAQGAGFAVVSVVEAWTSEGLAACDVLVVVSPRGAGRDRPLHERGLPAFAGLEVDALADWLAAGHGLLLITDHPPIGGATAPLAERLGLDMSDAFTEDPEHAAPDGYLVFSRRNGLLAPHPITDGTGPEEAVNAVAGFLGQSLAGPPGAVSLLTFGSAARDRQRRSTDRLWLDPSPEDALRSAAGRSEAVAFGFGSGRVVAVGDAAMLTSLGADSGFDVAGFDNRRLARNVLLWLAGEL
jgi:hypothetical protein